MAVTITFNFRPTDRAQNSYSGLTRADAYFQGRPNSSNWTGTGVSDDDQARALIQATREIDSLRLRGIPHVNYNNDQILHFPTRESLFITGSVSSATSSTAVDTGSLQNQQHYPDDYWNYGSIRITSGTGADQNREISDFVSSTATITVSENWSVTPDSTSKYELTFRMPDDVVYACYEMAYFKMPDATTAEFDDMNERMNLAKILKRARLGRWEEEFRQVNGIYIPNTAYQYLKKYLRLVY
jgi:hypothetical protein